MQQRPSISTGCLRKEKPTDIFRKIDFFHLIYFLVSMHSLYSQTKDGISQQMTNHVKPHVLSKEHAEAIRSSVKDIIANKILCKSGRETQVNSSENEKSVGELLTANNFQEISKEPTKAKASLNTVTVTVFEEDYYGYKRSVSHKYACTFQRPANDGLYFISQPCGSQSSPDFLTFHYKYGNVVSIFAIEYKGSGTKEKWNAHIQSMSRSIMYIINRKDKADCFFGEQLRNKESLLHALTHDELLRELVLISNTNSSGVGNVNIARPSHEFKEVKLDKNYLTVISHLESFIV